MSVDSTEKYDKVWLLNENDNEDKPAIRRYDDDASSSCHIDKVVEFFHCSDKSQKINHNKRKCAISGLLGKCTISMSILSIVLVMVYHSSRNSAMDAKLLIDYFSKDFDEKPLATIETGNTTMEMTGVKNESATFHWSKQPTANGSVALIMPAYPIFPRPQPVFDYVQPTNTTLPKVILLWTSLFAQKDWQMGPMGSTEPFQKLHCPISNCIVTDDRSQIQKADIVLINFRDDFKYSDRPTAEQRNPNQRWVFTLWETPDHTYDWIWQGSHRHYRNLLDFPYFFNWTMTYRLDSDIHFHYGRHIPLKMPDFSRVGFDRLASKTKTAVWMTSHCDTASHREDFVKALMNHIDVDTIGGCQTANLPGLTHGICARPTHFSGTKDECLEELSKTYKFYLSFENSLCVDYVTEKFYRAAKLDLIPVVLNGGDMSKFAPPNSYIDAQNFSSAADLADFLKKVGSDPALYNSYFWWKPFYDVEHTWDKATYVKHFCDVCAKATFNSAFPAKSYHDMDDWWTTQGKCHEGRRSKR